MTGEVLRNRERLRGERGEGRRGSGQQPGAPASSTSVCTTHCPPNMKYEGSHVHAYYAPVQVPLI